MEEEKKKVFISTAIPYVNAKPHIGFALELVQADAYARFRRERGDDVFFLTGTDENSLKNVQAAEKEGITTKELVDRNAKVFEELTRKLEISNNDFIRTSAEERHKKGAQKLWQACKRDIYKKNYKGFYCVGCEEFKRETDLEEGKCPEHPDKLLEEIEEENYFFKLSDYQKKLKDLIEGEKLKVLPEEKKNETISFIKNGLEDFSISRSKERAKDWGIEVPEDESQIMYVWFDALSNYITALDYAEEGEKFKKYWEKGEKIHFIGKGINRFHTIYWPAMLLSGGVKTPDKVFVHGYVTAEGQKMSKSIGNVVDPFELIEKYGKEAVRFYLLREIPTYGDGDFSAEKFEARYNGDLANGLGNFASRVLKLYSLAEEPKLSGDYGELGKNILETEEVVKIRMEEFRINEALIEIWKLIAIGDKYINDKKPWETKDKDAISNAVLVLKGVASLLKPFLPETAEKILDYIKEKKAIEKPLFLRLK